jgi:serine/threonine-protein kinase
MGDSAETSDSGDLSWNLPDSGDTEAEPLPKSKRGDDTFGTGTLIEGRYKLYKRLGKGAVGTVWEAYDQKLARPVALKLIRIDCDPEMVHRFVHEAKAAAALQTVHVVAVYDNGTHRGVPYIVMERLEGETVSDVLERNGQLRMEQIASLLVQCAAALRCAHDRGIVHRDLKPANLFVSRSDDGYETIKLLDFGVAKQPDDDATRDATESGVILGTPHYMSPEQARGHKDLDHRTDLWSMAVILYRAVTGKRPWTAPSAVDVLVRIISDKADRPSLHRPDIPEALDQFFERAFASEADDRFQSIDELREAFLEAADIQIGNLRDQEGSALGTGQFAVWDSAADIPRPRLSSGGSGRVNPPSIPSATEATKVSDLELGTLSASSSVRDFEEATRARKRSRVAIAGIAAMFFGGVIAAVVIGAWRATAPVTAATAATTAAPAPEVVEPAAPPATAIATASASAAPSQTSAKPAVGRRGRATRPGVVPKRPRTQPTSNPSPDGKKRLPLY